MEDKQTFQSDFRLFLLKAHQAWSRAENFFFAPLHKLARSCDQTHVFEKPTYLRLVK